MRAKRMLLLMTGLALLEGSAPRTHRELQLKGGTDDSASIAHLLDDYDSGSTVAQPDEAPTQLPLQPSPESEADPTTSPPADGESIDDEYASLTPHSLVSFSSQQAPSSNSGDPTDESSGNSWLFLLLIIVAVVLFIVVCLYFVKKHREQPPKPIKSSVPDIEKEEKEVYTARALKAQDNELNSTPDLSTQHENSFRNYSMSVQPTRETLPRRQISLTKTQPNFPQPGKKPMQLGGDAVFVDEENSRPCSQRPSTLIQESNQEPQIESKKETQGVPPRQEFREILRKQGDEPEDALNFEENQEIVLARLNAVGFQDEDEENPEPKDAPADAIKVELLGGLLHAHEGSPGAPDILKADTNSNENSRPELGATLEDQPRDSPGVAGTDHSLRASQDAASSPSIKKTKKFKKKRKKVNFSPEKEYYGNEIELSMQFPEEGRSQAVKEAEKQEFVPNELKGITEINFQQPTPFMTALDFEDHFDTDGQTERERTVDFRVIYKQYLRDTYDQNQRTGTRMPYEQYLWSRQLDPGGPIQVFPELEQRKKLQPQGNLPI